jgi:hypothetical protein
MKIHIYCALVAVALSTQSFAAKSRHHYDILNRMGKELSTLDAQARNKIIRQGAEQRSEQLTNLHNNLDDSAPVTLNEVEAHSTTPRATIATIVAARLTVTDTHKDTIQQALLILALPRTTRNEQQTALSNLANNIGHLSDDAQEVLALYFGLSKTQLDALMNARREATAKITQSSTTKAANARCVIN